MHVCMFILIHTHICEPGPGAGWGGGRKLEEDLPFRQSSFGRPSPRPEAGNPCCGAVSSSNWLTAISTLLLTP